MTTHVVTVDEKLTTISVFRCTCGEEKSFENGQDARHYGERHARNSNAELMVRRDGNEIPSGPRKCVKHKSGLGVMLFNLNYDATTDGRYS